MLRPPLMISLLFLAACSSGDGPVADRSLGDRSVVTDRARDAASPKLESGGVVDRSLVDRLVSPCQQSWLNGWKLQGSTGVECYGSCSDSFGAFTIDCSSAGCVCSGTRVGKKTCTGPGECQDQVNKGCCI